MYSYPKLFDDHRTLGIFHKCITRSIYTVVHTRVFAYKAAIIFIVNLTLNIRSCSILDLILGSCITTGSELALNVRKSRVFIVIMCMHGSDCYLFSRMMIRDITLEALCVCRLANIIIYILLFFFLR